MHNTLHTDTILIGAGMSGLATAFFLTQAGRKVEIIEKECRVGGVIESERLDGFLAEYGPNSVLETYPEIGQLIAGLGIQDRLEYANDNAKNRYIVRDGKLRALPLGPLAFLQSPLFSAKAKLRLCLEPLLRKGSQLEESLAGFVVRRLGREFLDYAIDPFVAGVYAGVPEELSVKSAFPKLHALEQEYGSLIRGAVLGARKRRKRQEVSKTRARMFSFPQGLATVIAALAGKLDGHIHTQAQIREIRMQGTGKETVYTVLFQREQTTWQLTAKSLVFTVPAYCYAYLPIQFDFPIRSVLAQIQYPPIAVVYFGFRTNPAAKPLDGFGFLVPRKEQRAILGTLWNSAIFNNRTPQAGGAALTTFVGGSRQPENALLSPDQLVALVKKELLELMGISQPPDVCVVRQVRQSIPQYNLGHAQRVAEIVAFEQNHPGLFIRGNFQGGIALGDVIHTSYLNAQQVINSGV